MYKTPITSNSYSACHNWMSRNYKKTKTCEFCDSKKFIEWALKKGKIHSHNRKDYLCLCSSCHKKYDYTEERRKKLSASLKKVPHTKEWVAKIAKANKGQIIARITRLKASEYQRKHPKPRDGRGRFCKE